jgi:hypothetical protein
MKKRWLALFWMGFLMGWSWKAHAAIVKDLPGALSRLLGHEARILDVSGIEHGGWDRGRARSLPWSGSYWPDILGGIANHYRDHSKTPSQIRFLMRYDLAKGRMFQDHAEVKAHWREFTQEELDRKLSPTEKYDLLLGDTEFRFTRAVMEEIDFRAHYLKKNKILPGSEGEGEPGAPRFADVEASYARFDREIEYRYWQERRDSLSYWFGICDGWAPASATLPRPVLPVRVRGMLGTRITFFPDDLKALGSYLFARTNSDAFSTLSYRFAGRPCAERGKARLDGSGRVLDFRCDDVDPGLFHLVLVNRIGVEGSGFTLDVDNNHKINNHPVARYHSIYFHPETGTPGTLRESTTPWVPARDRFRERRNPETRFLLGVRTEVEVRHYHWPEAQRDREGDRDEFDRLKTETYEYVLELDFLGRILGGEWGRGERWAQQPDFLWMSDADRLPYSEQSLFVRAGTRIDAESSRVFGNTRWAWDGVSPLPQDWIRAAREDALWSPPVVGRMREEPDGRGQVVPFAARNSVLKAAQPLSTIVYFLWDQADQSSMR